MEVCVTAGGPHPAAQVISQALLEISTFPVLTLPSPLSLPKPSLSLLARLFPIFLFPSHRSTAVGISLPLLLLLLRRRRRCCSSSLSRSATRLLAGLIFFFFLFPRPGGASLRSLFFLPFSWILFRLWLFGRGGAQESEQEVMVVREKQGGRMGKGKGKEKEGDINCFGRSFFRVLLTLQSLERMVMPL